MTKFEVININKKIDKMKVNIIVAVGENNVIGNHGKLPWYIHQDLQVFKKLTENKVVVMGRKTFENSIGHPLTNRINVVVSTGKPIDSCIVIDNPQKVFDWNVEEIFVIGGQQIYEHFLPMADNIYLTHVYGEFPGDTFFPELNLEEWEEAEYFEGDCLDSSDFTWGFSKYVRRKF